MSKDWIRDVATFHKHIAYPQQSSPTISIIHDDEAQNRLRYMQEEVNEYDEGLCNHNLIEMADALGDLITFAIGSALFHGIDLRPIMDEIHRSNMTKTPDPYLSYKKCTKGPDYKKPNIAVALYNGDLSDYF